MAMRAQTRWGAESRSSEGVPRQGTYRLMYCMMYYDCLYSVGIRYYI
jgi:hypothetical protein